MAKRVCKQWRREDMDAAVDKLQKGEIGFNAAHRKYNVPKPTLRRYFLELNKYDVLGRPKHFTNAQEKELIQLIHCLQSYSCKLTSMDIRKLAYQMAERKNIPHKFNKQAKMAGKKWYYNFIKTHNLSISNTKKPGINTDVALLLNSYLETSDNFESFKSTLLEHITNQYVDNKSDTTNTKTGSVDELSTEFLIKQDPDYILE